MFLGWYSAHFFHVFYILESGSLGREEDFYGYLKAIVVNYKKNGDLLGI